MDHQLGQENLLKLHSKQKNCVSKGEGNWHEPNTIEERIEIIIVNFAEL